MRSEKPAYVLRRGTSTHVANLFMTLALLLRIVWGVQWDIAYTAPNPWFELILPAMACLLFGVCLLVVPQRMALKASVIPMLLGIWFFVGRIFGMEVSGIHVTLCLIHFAVIAGLYILVAFSVLPIRRLWYPLFGLPLVYHIFIEDLIINRTVYTGSQWMQEATVVCIIAGLFAMAFAVGEDTPSADA